MLSESLLQNQVQKDSESTLYLEGGLMWRESIFWLLSP